MTVIPARLIESYTQTDYRVDLADASRVSIRIGQPLPATLQRLLPRPDAPWGYITAWNPGSEQSTAALNASAQRALRDTLQTKAPHARILHGCGIGKDGWREDSLFVIDASHVMLERLMRRFGQYAIVLGVGAGPARLHWNTDA